MKKLVLNDDIYIEEPYEDNDADLGPFIDGCGWLQGHEQVKALRDWCDGWLKEHPRPIQPGDTVLANNGNLLTVLALHNDAAWAADQKNKPLTYDIGELRRIET